MSQRDYKKFFTYPETAKFMAFLLDPKDGDWILEPSAGSGNLCKAILDIADCNIIAVELYQEWNNVLECFCEIVVIDDFLKVDFDEGQFDGCIANPPFGNGVDLMAHILKMYSLVKSGGRIVSIVPLDFTPSMAFSSYPLENWSTNSDGTKTEIKIIEIIKP